MASPEVERLLLQSRSLVGEAFQLTDKLNVTVDELESFSWRHKDRRAPIQEPYRGKERRHG